MASDWLNKSDNQISNDAHTRFIRLINGKTYMVDSTSPKEIKPTEDFWNAKNNMIYWKKLSKVNDYAFGNFVHFASFQSNVGSKNR